MWLLPSQELPQFLHSLLNVLNSPTESRRGGTEAGVGGGVGNRQVAHTWLHPSHLPCLWSLANSNLSARKAFPGPHSFPCTQQF